MRLFVAIIAIMRIAFANASALLLWSSSIPEGHTLDEVKVNDPAAVKLTG